MGISVGASERGSVETNRGHFNSHAKSVKKGSKKGSGRGL